MRIAYIAQSYPPMISGAAMFAQQLAEGMAQRGHQVLVIAASDKSYTYVIQKENLRILLLQSVHNPMRVGQRFLVYPRFTMLKTLREFSPDLIHSHDALQLGMIGLGYAKRQHVPIALTIHQLPWFVASYLPVILKPMIEKALWIYAGYALKKYSQAIAPTLPISAIITQKTSVKVNTIGYGLDLKRFSPCVSEDGKLTIRRKWKLPMRAPILLHVGRLDTDKHVDRLLQAAESVLKNSDAHLLVVGDGIHKPALMHQCKLLGITSRVHFTGYISSQRDLADIYRIASLFITASEIETQGIVLLEATASGLPIVAVRATCIPEIVHDDLNGYLTESGDVEAMSKALFKILKNPQIARAMEVESRRISEVHDLQFSYILYEKLYRQLQQNTNRKRISLRLTSFTKRGKGLQVSKPVDDNFR